MDKAGKPGFLSPLVRVRQWIGDVEGLSPLSRRRANSVECRKEFSEGASGYKSAPDNLITGQGFIHLKKLRDVCGKGFGECSYAVSPSKKDSYSTLYGAVDDLNIEDYNVSLESDLAETVNLLIRNEKDNACPRLFDNINSLNTNDTLFPVPWRSYVDVMDKSSFGSLETTFKMAKSTETINSPSLRNNKNKCDNHNGSSWFDKLSLKSNGSNNSMKKSKESKALSTNNCPEKTMRIKIGLQYFKNKRQLRLLLLTVDLLKSKHCKLFVKLSLLSNTSKQKVVSRRVRCSTSTVDLNEVLYLDVEDGKISGKNLRLCLCKETRFVKREKTIGEASVELDDLDVSSDTCLWLRLHKHSNGNMVASTSFELVLDSECSREETRPALLSRAYLNDSDLQLLLDCSKTQAAEKKGGGFLHEMDAYKR